MLSNASLPKDETNGKKGKARPGLFRSESAAVTAIAAVLLLGILFSLISVIKISYVPEWKYDAEQAQGYDTWDDMMGVKARVEILSRLMDSNSNYTPYGFTATVPFSMGGGEVPVFEPSKSSGNLEVNTEQCVMIITSGNHSLPYIVDCGGITYYSENRQYVDHTFRYENGALILAQEDGSLIKQSPSFYVENDSHGNYTFSISAVELLGEPRALSSNTFTNLRLTGCIVQPVHDSNDYGDVKSFSIKLLTNYPGAWYSYFNETAKEKGLEWGKDYTIEWPDGEDYVVFSFLPTSSKNLERLYVSKTVIGTELGAGTSFNYAKLGGGEVIVPGGTTSEMNESVMNLSTWHYFDTFSGTYNGKALSPSPDPDLLKDHDTSYSSLPVPPQNKDTVELTSYIPENEFSNHLNVSENLQLTFGFDNYTKFESSPSQATIQMVYKYESMKKEPRMVSLIAGDSNSIDKLPKDEWMVYSHTYTLSVQPSSPSSLTFNLNVYADIEDENGTFYIDYLAVRLN